MRTTVLRGADGTRHVVANGEIRISSSQTRIFSRGVLVLPLPYDVDVDHALALATAAGADLRSDPVCGPDILGDIEDLGVDAFGADRMDIRLTVETRPGRQWAVGRECVGASRFCSIARGSRASRPRRARADPAAGSW